MEMDHNSALRNHTYYPHCAVIQALASKMQGLGGSRSEGPDWEIIVDFGSLARPRSQGWNGTLTAGISVLLS